jgi:hypothetical protein
LEHTTEGQAPAILDLMPHSEDLGNNVTDLPDDVGRYLADAVKVKRIGVPDAAAVQLRRTLEAATTAMGANPRVRLVQQVQQLIEDGHVTKAFEPALGYIRKVGNVGAQAGSETLTDAEVEQALAFTTLLLRVLFELPARVAALTQAAPPPQIADLGQDAAAED